MISNEISANAMKELKVFCDEIKSTFNGIIDKFQRNVEKHIGKNCVDATQLLPALQNVEVKLAECLKGSEIFMPMEKLANVHNDVVSLDKKIINLKGAFQIPKIGRAANDVELIETTVQKLLEKFCCPILSRNVFENVTEENQNSTTDEDEKYVPTLLQELRLAIIKNDIDQFKLIVENPKMPPLSIQYILQYEFERHLHYFSNDPPKHSALILAGFNKSFDIIRYLIHLDGIDLLQRSGRFNIVDRLLRVKASSEVDKLVEEILTIEPKLVREIDSRNMNMLQLVIFQGSTYLCRLLVEKYNFDVNAQFLDGSPPLIEAIFYQHIDIYKELLSLGASPAVTDRDKNSTLHMACQKAWPEGICELVSKFPEMLTWKNNKGINPMSFILISDDLETMKTIYDCLKQNSIETEFLNKNYLVRLAYRNKASKILEWAKTIEQ